MAVAGGLKMEDRGGRTDIGKEVLKAKVRGEEWESGPGTFRAQREEAGQGAGWGGGVRP